MNVWAVMSKNGSIKTSTPNFVVSLGEKARMKSLLEWWGRINDGETEVGYVDDRQGSVNLSPTKKKDGELAFANPGDFCNPTFKVDVLVEKRLTPDLVCSK